MNGDLTPYRGFDLMHCGHRPPTQAECITAAERAHAGSHLGQVGPVPSQPLTAGAETSRRVRFVTFRTFTGGRRAV